MIFHFVILLGIAFLIAEVLMLVCWGFYLFLRRFSIVDIGWALSFFVIITLYALFGEGFFWRKVLLFIIASLWSLRLAIHLLRRYCRQGEDPRYNRFLQKWLPNRSPSIQALLLFTFQGALIAVLSLPFLLISENPMQSFATAEMFGLLIWMVGVVGESVADAQLRRFKQQPENQNALCEEGLWRYSRHPNYFFEWIVWLGFFLIALSAPWGWLSVLSPIIILYFLLKVSGIPPAEEQAIETKGEAYRNYQSRVSPFFLWFRKEAKAGGDQDKMNKD